MFKKYLTVITIVTALFSCQQEKEIDGFLVSANVNESANGKLVKLTSIDRANPIILDSTRVKDGKFTLKGEVEHPDMYILNIENVPGALPIIIENEEIDVTLYPDSLQSSLINGSKENDAFRIFRDISKPLREQNIALGNQFRQAQSNNDTAAMQNIRKQYDSLMKINTERSIDKMKEHNGNVISAIMLEDYLKSKTLTSKQAEEIYSNLTAEVKETRAAKEVKTIIDASLATEIGSVAPNFSAPNPQGETIALNDIKGKVTIIDFWAAWCGPCRKENPNVVKVYNKYHDKGLEIIGVSLDGSKRQNNPKEAWTDAIAKDGLEWHQVSNLAYFNDPIAKSYNINSIPATFILDSEGKIVAKNLRGPALEQKISELLN